MPTTPETLASMVADLPTEEVAVWYMRYQQVYVKVGEAAEDYLYTPDPNYVPPPMRRIVAPIRGSDGAPLTVTVRADLPPWVGIDAEVKG